MQILVTGADGFIGSHLVENLVKWIQSKAFCLQLIGKLGLVRSNQSRNN